MAKKKTPNKQQQQIKPTNFEISPDMPHLLLYTILKQKQQRKQQHLTHTTRLKEENRNTRRVNDVEIFDPLKSKWPNKHAHKWNKLSTLATTKSRSMLIFLIDALKTILSMILACVWCLILCIVFFCSTSQLSMQKIKQSFINYNDVFHWCGITCVFNFTKLKKK